MGTVGIIADIHSNLAALQKALDVVKEESVDSVIVCGDVVGYGKFPNECCERVRTLDCPVVAGNHDWAVAGLTGYRDTHSRRAVEGIEYTKRVITDENLAWLQGLPLTHREGDMEFFHASPVRPEEWYYLTLGVWTEASVREEVRENFAVMKGQVCFVGHSHIPAMFLEESPRSVRKINPNKSSYALEDRRAIIDVGSIGQPRTPSRKASLVIYDRQTRKVRFRNFAIET